MILTERHVISGTQELVRLCSVSKQLYNKCNFIMRAHWFEQKRTGERKGFIHESDLIKAVRHEECYKNLHNTKTAKMTIRQVIIDWQNFWKALKAYIRNPSRFIVAPKPPGYRKKLTPVYFFIETIRAKPLREGIITPTNDCFVIKSDKKPKRVRVTPKHAGFVIEVQYEQNPKEPKKKKRGRPKKHEPTRVCCIDLGVNNLCAITSDQFDPVLINGRILKSINREFNKNQCQRTSRKRYWRIENYFHHVSHLIISTCVKHNIDTIIVGHNFGWKQQHKLGQNFQHIPFARLIQKIIYKAELEGIKVVLTEEAYTSQASFLDKDEVPPFQKDVAPPQFSGKRVHRGLYRSKSGRPIHADVNGSLNIARKVIGDKVYSFPDRSIVAMPVRVNPLKAFCVRR